MTYKPFSIITVPFPFTDIHATKKRPALVLSRQKFQEENQHVLLAMITTAKNSTWYGDHQILDLKTTGLKTPSVIRQKLFTLDSRLILTEIGKLSKQDCKAFEKALFNNLLKSTAKATLF